MEKELNLTHNQMIKFTNETYFMMLHHGHLKIGTLHIQFMAIKQTFHQDPIFSNFTKHIRSNCDDNKMLMEMIFNIIGGDFPKI